MAFVTGTAGPTSAIGPRVAGLVERVRRARKARAAYRQTIEELSRLNERELADLGIHRTQIGEIAREAAARL